MSALALDLLREVANAGGTIRLEGDRLRLSAPEPLPDELRARLRRHKAEIVALLSAARPSEPAAPEPPPAAGAASLPEELADGIRAILAAEGAHGIPSGRWPRVRQDARRLVERGWLRHALALGWTAAELFGCDRRAPWHRLDRAGFVLLIGGHEILGFGAADAALRTSTGSVLRHRRRPAANPPVALLWELLVPGTGPTERPAAPATGPPSRGPTAGTFQRRVDGGDVLGGTPPPSWPPRASVGGRSWR